MHALHRQHGLCENIFMYTHQEDPPRQYSQLHRHGLRLLHGALDSFRCFCHRISLQVAQPLAIRPREEVHRYYQVGQLCRNHQHCGGGPARFDTPLRLESPHLRWEEGVGFFGLYCATQVCTGILTAFHPLMSYSIVAAVAAELNQFNRFTSEKDYTYGYWRSSLCVQIAQNLSIITACLPCLHPFIIKILAGTIKTEAIKFTGPGRRRFSQVFVCKESKSSFDAMSSQSSTLPFKEPTDYCRPLVTHGLDRSSAHLNSQHFNRFPTNVATPIHGADPPENVFMRSVEFPNASRPPTSHESHNFPPRSSKALPEIPKTLADVGVIPMPDWETDSGSSDGRNTDSRNSDRESGSSSPSRRPNSEYVFNRSKVISVPEESHLRDEDGQYYKKYYPPLPSPGMPKRPPRP